MSDKVIIICNWNWQTNLKKLKMSDKTNEIWMTKGYYFIIKSDKLIFKMNYEWQRDNILWLKLTKQFLKTKQYKKRSDKKIEKFN